MTLAKDLCKSKTYDESEIEAECGGGCFGVAQAISMKPRESKGKAKGAKGGSKQFHRALAILDLKVYLHPSQQNTVTLPDYGDDDDEGGRTQEDVDRKTKRMFPPQTSDHVLIFPATRSKAGWPRMVIFVKGGVGGFSA